MLIRLVLAWKTRLVETKNTKDIAGIALMIFEKKISTAKIVERNKNTLKSITHPTPETTMNEKPCIINLGNNINLIFNYLSFSTPIFTGIYWKVRSLEITTKLISSSFANSSDLITNENPQFINESLLNVFATPSLGIP